MVEATSNKTPTVGRFAPTPSGPLHFGSVAAAVASYMQAKSRGGKWFVRIDDLDTHRVRDGAACSILKTLEMLGLAWDGEVVFQSLRRQVYIDALHALDSLGLVYPCDCPRHQVKGRVYRGTCRKRAVGTDGRHALRVIVTGRAVAVRDAIQGHFQQSPETEIGDFIVRRADSVIAYHVATVVDDAEQGVTEVVRGADLLDSTPKQIYLQKLLGFPTPRYAHIPLVVDEQGRKLSKQTAGIAEGQTPAMILFKALEHLGQQPDRRLLQTSVDEIIQWGLQHWSLTGRRAVRDEN